MIQQFQTAFHLAHRIFPEGGTCLEFGVFTGGTYLWQARNIIRQYPSSRLIGFDSWQGLPPESEGVWFPSRHAEHEFHSPKDVVLSRLAKIVPDCRDDRFRLVDGFFSESLTPQLRQTIADVIFVNIDVDIHKSTLELLDFVKPLLRPGVILYWDDWKDPNDVSSQPWGEHLAWQEWSQQNADVAAEVLEVNPLNQRSMIVTQVGERDLANCKISLKSVRYDAFQIGNPARDEYDRFIELQRQSGFLAAVRRRLIRSLL